MWGALKDAARGEEHRRPVFFRHGDFQDAAGYCAVIEADKASARSQASSDIPMALDKIWIRWPCTSPCEIPAVFRLDRR